MVVQVLEEADRSLHDALCVIRCLVNKRFLIAGGASPEMEMNLQLSAWAKTLQGVWMMPELLFFQCSCDALTDMLCIAAVLLPCIFPKVLAFVHA
jgi:chaperonin GroEL (HSP60 family)